MATPPWMGHTAENFWAGKDTQGDKAKGGKGKGVLATTATTASTTGS